MYLGGYICCPNWTTHSSFRKCAAPLPYSEGIPGEELGTKWLTLDKMVQIAESSDGIRMEPASLIDPLAS
jgi:hypothetical protein